MKANNCWWTPIAYSVFVAGLALLCWTVLAYAAGEWWRLPAGIVVGIIAVGCVAVVVNVVYAMAAMEKGYSIGSQTDRRVRPKKDAARAGDQIGAGAPLSRA